MSRAACASSQPALDVFPPSSVSFRIQNGLQNGEEKRLEHKVRCSATNVEENLRTMKYSAVGVEH